MAKQEEDIIEKFRKLPKRQLSDIEKQLILILIEKSKIQRERSMSILNKGFIVFIAFVVMGYLSKYYSMVPDIFIKIMFVFGVIVIVVTMYFYEKAIAREENVLDRVLDNFMK